MSRMNPTPSGRPAPKWLFPLIVIATVLVIFFLAPLVPVTTVEVDVDGTRRVIREYRITGYERLFGHYDK